MDRLSRGTALRLLLIPVAIVGVLVAYGWLAAPTPIMNYTCGTVPAEACHEQAEILRAAATGAVRAVAITCIGECTRAKGSGNATVTLVDATTSTHAWSYAGDPNRAPTPTCVGLARDLCVQHVTELTADVSPSHHITGVTVTCTGTCDASDGDVLVVFVSEGGIKDTIGTTRGDPKP